MVDALLAKSLEGTPVLFCVFPLVIVDLEWFYFQVLLADLCGSLLPLLATYMYCTVFDK